MNPVLHIRNLNKTFGTTAALRDINLELRQGEMLFLLGPSGCGKTTLLRAIAGFEQPDSGEIWLKDRCIFNSRFSLPTQQRRIGYVVQEGVLFPHLSVYRNIAYGLGNGKGSSPQDRQRIEAVMSLTGIGELANRFPHQLSGGQQQRVACARAMMARPSVIFADEPTGNLDSRSSREVLGFLRDSVRDYGQSIVMVTHDPRAASFADRVLVLADGEITRDMSHPTYADILEVFADDDEAETTTSTEGAQS